jgi:hypothetical protein
MCVLHTNRSCLYIRMNLLAQTHRWITSKSQKSWAVWRGGNGEVLVGRDVIPYVGMRVLLSRQTRRFLNEQGQEDPSQGGAGVIVRLLAATNSVAPVSLTRDCNGAYCKVRARPKNTGAGRSLPTLHVVYVLGTGSHAVRTRLELPTMAYILLMACLQGARVQACVTRQMRHLQASLLSACPPV